MQSDPKPCSAMNDKAGNEMNSLGSFSTANHTCQISTDDEISDEKHGEVELNLENGGHGIDLDTCSIVSEVDNSSSEKFTFPGDSSKQHTDDTNRNSRMNVSNTESGYLTDSVLSRDRRYARESVGSDNSEQSITPSADNLMTFSTSSSNATSSVTSPASPQSQVQVSSHTDYVSPNSDQVFTDSDQSSPNSDQTSAGTEDHVGEVNKIYDECTAIIKQTSRIEQLDNLARINLNCDRKDISSINDIFATNFAPPRPESLQIQGENSHDSGTRARRQSEGIESLTDKLCVNDDRCDRKRSKSSGFPIPRQKEGVFISEDMVSKSLPHGKVVRNDSGLIEFIADDLQEKIRRSSPMSKTASSDVSSRRSSMLSLTSVDSMASSSMATSMTSGMSRSYPQSPDCIPPIDPMAIHEIENQARLVADGLDLMMGNLRNNLHQMSAISVGCEEAYKTSVDVTCDSVDASIKSMYALMAKCEELSMAMVPVYKLADQIKEIKRLLDRFEGQVGEKP